MLNQTLVNILVNRIRSGGVNPSTGEVMKLEDIKVEVYRVAVQEQLATD